MTINDKNYSIMFEHFEIPYVEDIKWETRRDFLTPGYTTNWNDIPVITQIG